VRQPALSSERLIENLARELDFHPTADFFTRNLKRRGTGSARIAIAGLGLRLEGLAREDEIRIRSRYGVFVRDDESSAQDVRVTVVEAQVPAFLRPRSDPQGAPELYRLEQFSRGSRLFAYSYDFAGWYDTPSRQGQLALTATGDEALHRSIENYLRSVTAHRVIAEGGFVLHGSGLVRNGRAHVFFGPSGSGKTTVTLLSEAEVVLSDDLVLIREGAHGFEACSVPFRGVYREPPQSDEAFPMAGLYRLIQHPADSLERLSPARGAAELLGSLPFVMEGGGGSRALEVVGRAVQSVPVYRLRFRKSPEFWALLSEET